ncbi:alpha-N-acetylglucosaminidase [Alistipes provencensis]|uniref:alpha-N-acetylglucosaminidase n=1 Tax=Alistipes provencensis TaxID=1816676 RepID=UPI0007EC7980|nr:alpha-N-acetylglucosaminidase [Alistipes provencensis]
MKKLFILLITTLLFLSPCQVVADAVVGQSETQAATALARRILPRLSSSIRFVYIPSDRDHFVLEMCGDELQIAGNSAVSMAFGLNCYLRDYCRITVTWYRRDKIDEPKRLPIVVGRIEREARVENRFFLNYCTYGYSLNWWQWDEWEHFIDWMALNGVTMALATTGQEAVWQRVWRQFGLDDETIRNYFTGPSYLPWHRMANIDTWHGPLPQSWIDGQLELQQRIVARERELGIQPIFTSFTGHVPKALKQFFPDADIKRLNPWTSFEKPYNSYYLNPAEPLFNRIQQAYMQEQRRLFGESSIYGVDPFNELDPPSWDPEYLARAARLTYESITRFDKNAVWLQMAWVFYHKRKDWTPERLKAYLCAVPKGKLLMLDYYCDKVELWRSTESFYGQPFIWSYLGNFGGNTMLAGDMKDVSRKLDRAYVEAGCNFVGIGCTLEGLDVNPFMYEYVLDRAWIRVYNDAEWIDRLADRRSGCVDAHYRQAWQILYDKVYRASSGNRSAAVCARPNLESRSKWSSTHTDYDNRDLLMAWEQLTFARPKRTPSSRFDCVNIPRQCLENYFGGLNKLCIAAYRNGDRDGVVRLSSRLLELLDDIDLLVATDTYFLLGKWISDARRMGTTPAEKDYFEYDARNILTTWGGRGYSLNDYANRTWSGLVSGYYKERWKRFYDRLQSGGKLDEESLLQELQDFEWEWVGQKERFAERPRGDAYKLCQSLYAKYAVAIDRFHTEMTK